MKTKLGIESTETEQNVKNKISNMYPALKRYCQFLTRNGWDAEDLAHETIEKMYRSYIHEKGIDRPITNALVYRIAYNGWMDQMRKRAREQGRIDKEPSTDPLKALPETYSISEFLIKHLTPQQIVLFVLKDAFQYSIEEISFQLGLTEGSVKGTLFRARQHFHKYVIEEDSQKKGEENVEAKLLCLKESIIQSIQQEQPLILVKQYKKLFSKDIPMCKGPINLFLRAAA